MLHYLELTGPPRQRGRIHGETLREAIGDFRQALARGDGVTDRVIANMQEYVSCRWPELIEEWRGIAEGAGLTYADVVRMNTWNALGKVRDSGCTALAVRGRDKTVLGKTSDIDDVQASFYVVRKVTPDEGLPFLAVGMTGTLWTEVGLNAGGLACGVNSGPAFREGQTGHGLPQHLAPGPMLHRVRQASALAEELRQVVLAGKGVNMILADADGEIVNVEKSFDRHGRRHLTEGRLLGATNIFLTITEGTLKAVRAANSDRRMMNLERWGRRLDGVDPVRDVQDILADATSEGAISQHGQEGMTTYFTHVADTAERVLYINEGPGEKRDYREFRL